MSKKKISFKAASEIREVEKNIDEWVRGPSKNTPDASPKILKEEKELYRFTLDIPKYLHRRIKKTCAAEDISMKEKLTEILLEAFPEK